MASKWDAIGRPDLDPLRRVETPAPAPAAGLCVTETTPYETRYGEGDAKVQVWTGVRAVEIDAETIVLHVGALTTGRRSMRNRTYRIEPE
jgi:hypothetical protein